jgi:hypothetical protein
MMPRSNRQLRSLMIGIACFVALLSLPLEARPSGNPPAPKAEHPTTTSNDIISVSGAKLLLNGKPFIVHGVELDGLLAPKDWYGPEEYNNDFLAASYSHFGPEELQHAKEFGVNTIDFAVGQMGLDPQNTQPSTKDRVAYSADYVAELTKAIHLARSMGFTVMVSIVSTKYSGDGRNGGLPQSETIRTATELANIIKDDRGIMLELLVEPYGTAHDTWPTYINGGNGYVGINQMIQAVRSTGARNLLIVQPLIQYFTWYQAYLDRGGTPITDTIPDALAYGVHPYFDFKKVGTTRASWDDSFGTFAESHPVIVTEWNENTSKVGGILNKWCSGPDALSLPLQAFHYFNEKGINGVVGWAFDNPATIVADWKGTPRTMDGFQCGQRGGGIGALLKAYFAGNLPPLPR